MANTEVGSGYVSLWPQIKGSLSGEGRKLGSQLMSGLEGGLKARTIALGNFMSNMVQSTIGSFGELVSTAASSADTIKKFDQSMNFAGLKQSTIDAASKNLKTYADQTVYDLNTIYKTASILGGNSVKEFDKVTMSLGNLTAAAGGGAQEFDAAALAMTQIVGVGKLSSGDWRQFSSNLAGASTLMKEKMLEMGAYTGSFEEALSKGEISAEEFLAAIKELGMDESAIEAAKSTQTFEGAIGNLQAAIEDGLLQVINAIGMDNITNAINSVTTAVEAAAPRIAAGFQSAFQFISAHGGAIKAALIGIGTAAGGLKAVSLAMKGMTIAKNLSGMFKALAARLTATATAGVGAGAGLGATAAGEEAAGTAAKMSAKSILAMAAAVVALGAGVLLAAAGIYVIAQAAIQLASAGAPAMAMMLGLVVGIAALVAVFALFGPELDIAAPAMLAFGAACLLVGAGVWLAANGIAALATQLPTISEYGLSAAGGLGALGAAMVVAMVGALLLGVGCIVLGAGLVVAGAGLAVVGAATTVVAGAMTIMAGAVLTAGVGFMMMAAGLQVAASALPIIASAAPTAAAGLVAIAGAGVGTGAALRTMNGPMRNAGSAASSAASGISGAASAINSMAGAAGAGAAGAASLASSMQNASSVASSGASGFNTFASSVASAMSRATSAVSSAISQMRSVINGAHFTLPRVNVGPLPHFRMTGDFNPKNKSTPVVSVSWYASGGVFDAAQVIGVGERGPEAVLPLKKSVLGAIGDGIARNSDMGGNGVTVNINGARINDDSAIESIVYTLMETLNRKQRMGVAY